MTALIRLSHRETWQLALAAWTGVALAVASQFTDLVFEEVALPVSVCLGLVLLAAVYNRSAPNFCLTLKSLAGFVGFSAIFCPLTYALAQFRPPLVDPLLKSLDLAMGINAGEIVSWVNARPTLGLVMRLAYFSAIPQTALAIAWFGLRNDQVQLNQFLIRFIVCALLTAACFAFAPAIGLPASYDVPVPPHYAPIIEHLNAVRDGSMTVVSLGSAEGLIGVPSFHCEWAVLLIAVFWKSPFRWPVLALNVVMIASTIPVGMHYATDVLAGLLVCGIVFLGERIVAALASTRFEAAPCGRC
jgi:membrane-associated phospholipid phosphatase